MIIFDLDGTLADCEHRRSFVVPGLDNRVKWHSDMKGSYDGWWINSGEKWKPDWDAFYEACDQDKPIKPLVNVFNSLIGNDYCQINNRLLNIIEIEIWSGRSDSVRQKTLEWLEENIFYNFCDFQYDIQLKMRPIGDFTSDDVLKEKWLDEALAQGKEIEYVFDDRPKVIRMWRRRGISVFNCCQHDEEF